MGPASAGSNNTGAATLVPLLKFLSTFWVFADLFCPGGGNMPVAAGEGQQPSPGSQTGYGRPTDESIVALVLFGLITPWADQHATTVLIAVLAN